MPKAAARLEISGHKVSIEIAAFRGKPCPLLHDADTVALRVGDAVHVLSLDANHEPRITTIRDHELTATIAEPVE